MTVESKPVRPVVRTIGWWLAKPCGAWISLRAYCWARRQLIAVKASLPVDGTATKVERPASALAPRGHRGLHLALKRVSPTCLERALVLQAWLSTFEDAPDVVIGVRKNTDHFEAHAWIDGNDPWFDASYDEITRLPMAD